MKRNSYYALTQTGKTATINIYGEITSWPWLESDVSADNLSRQLEQLQDVTEIAVYINSYGGEVAEGLAIYNALKRHKAKITTYCDGFACSIASVIFMAGDERIMNDSSLLMIHNAWSCASGNAQELRKQADDLEKITQASVIAYKAHSTLSEDEIKALLDAESWIMPEEALQYGFATSIAKTESKNASQNARARLFDIVKMYRAAKSDEEENDEPETGDEEKPDTGDENPDNPQPDDDPDEDEPPTDDEDGDEEKPDESEDEEKTKEAAQRWSGFFNALLKM